MSFPSTRRLLALAAGTALLAAPLGAVSPSAAAPGAATTTAAGDTTRAAQCAGSRPYKDGYATMSIHHDFPLLGKKWRKHVAKRSCAYRNPRAKLTIGWARGAGSMKALRERVRKARNLHTGFHLKRLINNGARFDGRTKRTNVAEFTFRGAGGKRQHVRVVGDRYTVLTVRSSQRAWKHGIGKTARRAHRGMDRTIIIAM